MRPYFRQLAQGLWFCGARPLALGQPHESTHLCLPWDHRHPEGPLAAIYAADRKQLLRRSGVLNFCRARRWSLHEAGALADAPVHSAPFSRIRTSARLLGRDARFFYIEHATLQAGRPANVVVLRLALQSAAGIEAPQRVLAEHGAEHWNPALPDRVVEWSESESACA